MLINCGIIFNDPQPHELCRKEVKNKSKEKDIKKRRRSLFFSTSSSNLLKKALSTPKRKIMKERKRRLTRTSSFFIEKAIREWREDRITKFSSEQQVIKDLMAYATSRKFSKFCKLCDDISNENITVLKQIVPRSILNLEIKEYNLGTMILHHLIPQPTFLKHLLGVFNNLEINSPDFLGCSPLHFAACNKELSSLQILLDHGANPNVLDIRKESCLHLAARNGEIEIMQTLLKFGCDSTLKNIDGLTCIDLVDQNTHYGTKKKKKIKNTISKYLQRECKKMNSSWQEKSKLLFDTFKKSPKTFKLCSDVLDSFKVLKSLKEPKIANQNLLKSLASLDPTELQKKVDEQKSLNQFLERQMEEKKREERESMDKTKREMPIGVLKSKQRINSLICKLEKQIKMIENTHTLSNTEKKEKLESIFSSKKRLENYIKNINLKYQ